jgi:uncharacterized Fe-S cluster-containing radical SAM superfamily enzyme
MVDRDPTTGELAVLLEQILNRLNDVATKEFVQSRFDAFNDRVARLEFDQKEWTKVSTAAHVELDRDSKARHAETKADLEALEVKIFAAMDKQKTTLTTRIDGITAEQKSGERELKQVRNGRVTQWIGIGIAWLGTVALWFIDRGTA